MIIKLFINPEKFYRFSNLIFKPLLLLSCIALSVGLIFALYLSPDDYQQGSTVRIMYVHVPSAWLSLLIFLIMTIYSIIALAFKIPFGFILIILSASVVHGTITTSQSNSEKYLKIFFLIP